MLVTDDDQLGGRELDLAAAREKPLDAGFEQRRDRLLADEAAEADELEEPAVGAAPPKASRREGADHAGLVAGEPDQTEPGRCRDRVRFFCRQNLLLRASAPVDDRRRDLLLVANAEAGVGAGRDDGRDVGRRASTSLCTTRSGAPSAPITMQAELLCEV